MKPRVPPHIAAIKPYEPGKPVEELEREYGVPNAVKLASNENPLGPSPKAVEAIRLAASGVHFYPDGGGYYLRRKLAGRLGVAMENVVLGCGSNELLDLLARAYLAPGDEAVMGEQAFVIYRHATASTGAKAVRVPMKDHAHDLRAMADAVGPRTRIVFVANPDNPSGTIVRRAEVEAFLRRVPEDVLVVMDEAYFEYARRDPDYPDSMEGFSED
ncbi:MAG: aminotransferase class I/II-fold pyridoxal phosphate-dependent enzyme, partial [Candidatus Methylomirabilis sp.]|nr:aminotransferase class I/II-fold pyridoxal phosphate-dependent enzyme [Deltaproteobacteria bacterium]